MHLTRLLFFMRVFIVALLFFEFYIDGEGWVENSAPDTSNFWRE